MRKAAIIVGLFFSLMVVCGIVFKFLHLPGGSSLVFYGTGLFFLIFSPLHAIYRYRTTQSKIGKVASFLGGFAGSVLGISYVFFLQRYPGGAPIFLIGIFLSAVFLIFYIISLLRIGSDLKKIGIFDVIVLVIVAVFFINKNVSFVNYAEIEKQVIQDEIARSEQWKLGKEVNEFYSRIISDTNVAKIQLAEKLHQETFQILENIYKIKAELISQHMGIDPKIADTIRARLIRNPADYDYPTHYFIGPDPGNITGKAKDLEASVFVYYDHVLKLVPDTFRQKFKSQIRPLIPSPIYNEKIEREVSWAWYKFYHKTIIETITNLVKLQIDILTAEKLALEQIQKSSQ